MMSYIFIINVIDLQFVSNYNERMRIFKKKTFLYIFLF
ncbi:hypothetical protein B4144_3713 [Bacillus atrophaeus]|nr:hypothetical protein B4144_3713 [Bacillus atrophaeus]